MHCIKLTGAVLAAAMAIGVAGCGADGFVMPTSTTSFTGTDGTTGNNSNGTTGGNSTTGSSNTTGNNTTTGTTNTTGNNTATGTTGTTTGNTTGATSLAGITLSTQGVISTYSTLQGAVTPGQGQAPNLGHSSLTISRGGAATLFVGLPGQFRHILLGSAADTSTHGDLSLANSTNDVTVIVNVTTDTLPGAYQMAVYIVDANNAVSLGQPLSINVI